MSDATDAHLHRRLHERVHGLERLALGRMKAVTVISVLAGVLTPSFPLRTDADDITVDLLGLAAGRTDDGVVVTVVALVVLAVGCLAVLILSARFPPAVPPRLIRGAVLCACAASGLVWVLGWGAGGVVGIGPLLITVGTASAAVLVFTPSYIAIWDGERT